MKSIAGWVIIYGMNNIKFRFSVRVRGFTLIELLVVISIISMLSSVILASLSAARDKAKISAAVQFESSLYQSSGDEIVGDWEMDEVSGTTVADSSGNNNHGSISTGIGSTDTPNSGRSVQFTSGDFITVPSNYKFGTGDFTFSFWAKHSTLVGLQTYFEDGSWTEGIFLRKNDVADKLAVMHVNADYYKFTFAPEVNKWCHIALTRKSGIIKMYVNGVNIPGNEVTPGSPDISPTNPKLYIGALGYDGSGQNMLGNIDNFRIYKSGFSIGQIQKLYAEGLRTHPLAKI